MFIPILTIIAGLDLKIASSFSAFMVTGGSIANVMYNLRTKTDKSGRMKKGLVDYDIAILSEPCMLLGVSVGVVCNHVFPEWLITILFAVFLVWSTFKTCSNGVGYWKTETAKHNESRNGCEKVGNGVTKNGEIENLREPLMGVEGKENSGFPWKKLMVLVMVWFSFFIIYLIRGNSYGQVPLVFIFIFLFNFLHALLVSFFIITIICHDKCCQMCSIYLISGCNIVFFFKGRIRI